MRSIASLTYKDGYITIDDYATAADLHAKRVSTHVDEFVGDNTVNEGWHEIAVINSSARL